MKKLVIVFILFLCISCTNENKVKVIFYKVGKADSILILDHDKTILLDTGEADDGPKILADLKNRGVKKLDYLILSHYDKDHIGGAAEIVKNMPVDYIYGPNYIENSFSYKTLETVLDAQNKAIEKLETDLKINNLEISVPLRKYDKENDMSLIVRLIDGEVSFLFLGDIMDNRINDVLTNIEPATLVKVPYHGHFLNNTEALFAKLKPVYAVITSSIKNPEDEALINVLNKLKVRTYKTRDGTVICTSDKVKISCE